MRPMPGSGKQRRSISIARPVYDALRARCETANLPVAAFVEHVLRSMLDMAPNARPSSMPDPAKATIRARTNKARQRAVQHQAEIKIARDKILADNYLMALREHGGDVVAQAMDELTHERAVTRVR